METSPRISIVIVNYRSAARIGRLLRSLPRAADISIIVANNDLSERRVLEELSRTAGFILIETGANRGFAAGANTGALAAEGDIIGFLNPDMLWSDTDIRSVRALFEENPKTGIIGLRLTSPSGETEAWSSGNDPSLAGLILANLYRTDRHAATKEAFQSIDWVSGGALFIRTELFRKLGGFDERFFLYFEDADLCRRARQSGSDVLLAGHLPIIHFGGLSQESRPLQKRHFYASQGAYYRKHRGAIEYRLLRFFRFLRYGI